MFEAMAGAERAAVALAASLAYADLASEAGKCQAIFVQGQINGIRAALEHIVQPVKDLMENENPA